MDLGGVDPQRLAAAAATALAARGVARINLVERLRGSDRAVVVRARAMTAGGDEQSVILKLALTGDGGAREEAALRLLADRGARQAVPLLGVGNDPPVLVLTDLGTSPTLADRLLGDDPDAARSALVAWAHALGGLQAATTGARDGFAAALAASSGLGAPPVDTTGEELARAATALTVQLPRLDLSLPPAAAEELRGISELLDSGPAGGAPSALVPGDTCPDNAVFTPGGTVLLDFEGAEYRAVAWEAAYLLTPWPSCWCSWRLPEAVAQEALAAWRAAVLRAMPAVADPAFVAQLDAAAVAWTFITAAWFLPAALDGDPAPADPRLTGLVPRRRALVQHRAGVAAERAVGRLPALATLAEQLRGATLRAWGEQPLALAPAFQ